MITRIKSLGYTAIWISPIFQNRENSYHGYGQIDFTVIDERFGTLSEFRSMVNAAHKKGMYVIVDIVVNHLDNLYYFKERGPGGREYSDSNAPFRLHLGEYDLIPHNTDEIYEDFWVNNYFYEDGQYPDVFGEDGFRKIDDPITMGTGSYWESDFHHNGNLEDYADVWQNHLGKIYGLYDDLRTTHPRVQGELPTDKSGASCFNPT